MAGSNPPIHQPRPFVPFPKVYTKNMNPPSPLRENWGRGEEKKLKRN